MNSIVEDHHDDDVAAGIYYVIVLVRLPFLQSVQLPGMSGGSKRMRKPRVEGVQR